MFTHLKYLVLTVSFFVVHEVGFSQNDSAQQSLPFDSAKINYDSTTNKVFNQIKQFGDSLQRKNLRQYTEDTIATRQDETIALIKKLTLEAHSYVENGLDTTGLDKELEQIENWYAITSDGVFINTGTIQTHRNLETSYKIMRELLIRIMARKSSLEEYYEKLVRVRNSIDSLYKTDILYKFSTDSAVLMRYASKLTLVLREIKPIDSSLKRTLISVSEMHPTINILVEKLSSSIAQIELLQKQLSSKIHKREANNLGAPIQYIRPINEIINFSMSKEALAFVFYVNNTIGKIVLLLVFVVACGAFLLHTKRKLQSQNVLDKNKPEHAVLKYPILSGLFIVLNIFQFIFIDPPFIFAALIWILSGLSLTFILKDVVDKYWVFAWLILFALFLFACFDNLILQASRPERWGMFALSMAGVISGSAIILKAPRNKLGEKILIYFVGFVVIMQIASILTNAYGRYNLSKTSLTAGFFNVVLAILFFWTLRFINQGFAFVSRVYGRTGARIFKIEFAQSPALFYVLLFFGWFVLFARNFYVYKFVSVPVRDFIVQKRTIGDFSFTIASVLEFFLILYISALISRMLSFLASAKPGEGGGVGRKGYGRWLLVIRISIVTIGLLAAFAALGIPMDRLTIILSALSVGIGFGLQGLINNLVSGLIISFEHPVRVGDTVEIGGQSGTVKSIGFRSSIITTPAGANVVIPNGNLLNQHLINWTRDTTSAAVDIPVSLPHGINLEQAMKMLTDLPEKDVRILPHPRPIVIIKQFNASSIDMQLTFWVSNLNDLPAVKTDIIVAIDRAFKQFGQVSPPQQEVEVSSLFQPKDS